MPSGAILMKAPNGPSGVSAPKLRMSGTEVPTTSEAPMSVAPMAPAPMTNRRRVSRVFLAGMARSLTGNRRGILDRRSNPLIGPAAADIAAHGVVDILVAGA